MTLPSNVPPISAPSAAAASSGLHGDAFIQQNFGGKTNLYLLIGIALVSGVILWRKK